MTVARSVFMTSESEVNVSQSPALTLTKQAFISQYRLASIRPEYSSRLFSVFPFFTAETSHWIAAVFIHCAFPSDLSDRSDD